MAVALAPYTNAGKLWGTVNWVRFKGTLPAPPALHAATDLAYSTLSVNNPHVVQWEVQIWIKDEVFVVGTQ